MTEYNVKSEHAAEFIHDGEIRATLIDGYFYIFGRNNTFKVEKLY